MRKHFLKLSAVILVAVMIIAIVVPALCTSAATYKADADTYMDASTLMTGVVSGTTSNNLTNNDDNVTFKGGIAQQQIQYVNGSLQRYVVVRYKGISGNSNTMALTYYDSIVPTDKMVLQKLTCDGEWHTIVYDMLAPVSHSDTKQIMGVAVDWNGTGGDVQISEITTFSDASKANEYATRLENGTSGGDSGSSGDTGTEAPTPSEIYYAANIERVNGTAFNDTVPRFTTQKSQYTHTVGASATELTVGGWSAIAGGQGEFFYSTDNGTTWRTVTSQVLNDRADAAGIIDVAKTLTGAPADVEWVQSNVAFTVSIDLSSYKGQTISKLILAQTSSNGTKCNLFSFTDITVPQEGSVTPPVDETPEVPTPDVNVAPSTSYRYYTNIDYINGKGANGSTSPYQGICSFKSQSNSSVATVSSGVSADADKKVSITGWALVNGGQMGHYWSVDGTSWYECVDTKYNVNMSNWADIVAVATANANLTSTADCEEKGKFTNASADLSPWAGQTVTLYFGVRAKVDASIISVMVKIENVSVPASHTHTPGDAATCTSAQTCTSCGEQLTAALGHSLTSYGAKDATCTESGYFAYEECARCDYTTYQATDALGHDETSYDAKDATCTESGHFAYVECSRCDYTTYKKIPATGIHTDGDNNLKCDVCDGEITCLHGGEIQTLPAVAPTCTSAGLTEGKKCLMCNEVFVTQEIADALGHTEQTIPGRDATCALEGLTEGKSCSVCGEITVEQTVISVAIHRFTSYKSNNDETCQKNATETARCDMCNTATDTREVAGSKLVHKYTYYISGKDATCTSNGTKFAYCDYGCGSKDTRTDEGSKLDHSFDPDIWESDDEEHWHECTLGCGTALAGEAHTYSKGICDICGHGCDHVYATYAYNNDARCEVDGTETASCANGCGRTNTRTKAGTALGHLWDNACDTICNNFCGATRKPNHSWTPASCTSPKTCSVCRETEGGVLAHSYKGGICSSCGHECAHLGGDATCTEAPVCEICGASYGEALGHTERIDAYVAPTCTSAGLTEGKHCTACDYVILAQEEIPAIGHAYDDEYDAECNNCGEEREVSERPTEPQPTEPEPTEHTPTEPRPTDPTPTEPAPTEPAPTEKPTESKPAEPTEDNNPSDGDDNDHNVKIEKRGCKTTLYGGVMAIFATVAALSLAVTKKKNK